jgi:hypothetical protein
MIGHFGDGLAGETGPCFRHEFAGCQYGGQEESVRCIDIPTSMTREAGFESLEVDQGDETDAGWKFGPLEYSGDEFVQGWQSCCCHFGLYRSFLFTR